MATVKSKCSKTVPAAKEQRISFNCVCCCENHTAVPVVIQGSTLCVKCFKSGILPQFEAAISNETNYPVTWGGHELTIEDYLDHVSPDLLARWNTKLPEYRTAVQDRLYCTGKVQKHPVLDTVSMRPAPGARPSSQDSHCCGAFIGSKTALRTTIPPPHVVVIANLPSSTKLRNLEASLSQSFGRILERRQLRADPAFVAELTFVNEIAAQQFLALYDGSSNLDGSILHVYAETRDIAQHKGRILECTKCVAEICTKCSKVLSTRRAHKCELVADEHPFRGLIRGRDYQECPKQTCQVKIALRDGCNHMKCRLCRTEFCFICGTEATHFSRHWQTGSPCPRFGFAGSRSAIHDTDAAIRRYEEAEERAAANREAQRVRDEQQRIRNERQRIEDAARRQLETARIEEAMEAERRRGEDAPIASSTECQRMLKDQNELKTLRTFSRSRLPTDPWYSLLGILLEELEVHVAHLRSPDGRHVYQLRPAAIAANQAIRERIVLIGLEKLAPITMLPILSRYNDAWHGEQKLKEVASSTLGRIRHRHQLAIQQVFRLLPLDLAHPWILRVRDLCVLLDLGTERYVRRYRVLRDSQGLADTLKHNLAYPRYVELLAAIREDTSFRQDERGRQANALLAPVIDAYELAVLGDTRELQIRFRGLLDPPVS